MEEHCQIALREANRHRAEAYLALFFEHRTHKGFAICDDPMRMALGFRCCGLDLSVQLTQVAQVEKGILQRFNRVRRYESRSGFSQRRRKFQRARKRSKALLSRFLSKHQRRTLRGMGAFEVVGQDGRTYEISKGQVRQGATLYCFIDAGFNLPCYDRMLFQKLYIEKDIASFLDLAVAREDLTPMPVPEEVLDDPYPYVQGLINEQTDMGPRQP